VDYVPPALTPLKRTPIRSAASGCPLSSRQVAGDCPKPRRAELSRSAPSGTSGLKYGYVRAGRPGRGILGVRKPGLHRPDPLSALLPMVRGMRRLYEERLDRLVAVAGTSQCVRAAARPHDVAAEGRSVRTNCLSNLFPDSVRSEALITVQSYGQLLLKPI
jgi:hypothetical protein